MRVIQQLKINAPCWTPAKINEIQTLLLQWHFVMSETISSRTFTEQTIKLNFWKSLQIVRLKAFSLSTNKLAQVLLKSNLIRMALKKCVAVQLGVLYDTPGHSRREGGLTSCRGHSWQFRVFTTKELETARVVQKLLGVPTIGSGSARAGGGGGGSKRRQICPSADRNTLKRHQKRAVLCTFWLKNHPKQCFLLKSS